MYIDCTIDCIKYRLLNIYCPNNNKERCEFLDDIYPYFVCNRNLIFAGDFNCIMNNKLDKKGGNPDLGTRGSENIKSLISDFDMCDSFRHLYPQLLSTTWYSKGQNVSCRLDRIYVSNSIKSDIRNVNVSPVGCSDHDTVILTIHNNTYTITGPGFWKINDEILKSFKQFWLSISDGITPDKDFWSIFKNNIKQFIINYCKKKNKVKFSILKEYQKKIFFLQKHEKDSPGDFVDQVYELKMQIYAFQKESFNGSKIRSKARLLDESE